MKTEKYQVKEFKQKNTEKMEIQIEQDTNDEYRKKLWKDNAKR